MMKLFDFKRAESPLWYVRIWRFVAMYWPNEPWHRRVEILFRR